ncbi:DnaD domain protein [Bacillus idriensis]|uniref:DnaD domain protein n=1 Tax=Metabacillus idriensis TaxID=324768 RepID=A0A6I2MBX2_9BACI|nr:replication protein [Metabacillus idriensis]MRX54807.1 DnaD domain protein [Metabacillus idriensis]
MANVQLENGFIRIATELMDEIIRRDFSKRQLAILHFIIRLSYGCQKKDCIVEKLSDFEIAGVYKTDVKKELKFLSESKVIVWDHNQNLFSVNKDYEKWQITPSKGWDSERMDKLLHHNIKRKKVSKTLTDLENIVSKTLTEIGIKVSKTLTSELVKHLLEDSPNAWESKSEEVLKDIIKDIYLKINKEEEEISIVERIIILLQKSKILEPNDITEFLRDDIEDVINNFGFEQPEEMIIEAIKDAARVNGRTWKYVYKKLVAWKKQGFKTPSDLERDSGQEVTHGATIHQYRRGHAKPARKAEDSITGGQIGWIGRNKKV